MRLTSLRVGRGPLPEDGGHAARGRAPMLPANFDAILLGAMGDPRVPDNRHAADILLGLRFRLDLYVNYRPVSLFHEKLCPLKGVTPKDVDFVVFRENTEGLYVMMGGNFKKGTARRGGDGGRPQHAQGGRADHPPGLRVRARPRPHEGGDGGQVQRADPRPRALAARRSSRWRPSTRASKPATSTRTTSRCRWCATRRSSRSSSPPTCSATSSPISRPRCRAAWAWPPPATSTPAASSLFEPVHGSAPASSRARTSPTPWAPSSPRA